MGSGYKCNDTSGWFEVSNRLIQRAANLYYKLFSVSQNVTLKDIARKTNLSIGAVSKALAGYPQVSQETRQRVQAASDQLNYQPKSRSLRSAVGRPAAKRGRRGEQNHINLILTENWGARSAQWMPALAKASQRVGLRLEISFVELEGSPASSRAADRAAGHSNGSANLSRTPKDTGPAARVPTQPETWSQAIKRQAQNVQGMLLFGCFDSPHLQNLASLDIPIVVMGDMSLPRTGQGLPVHLVSTDKIAMGQLAAQTLIQQGHTRIGFFCGVHPAGGWNHQWLAGYRLALMHSKLPIEADLQVVCDMEDPLKISQAAASHFAKLDQPPTAYITPSINVASCFNKLMSDQNTPIEPGRFIIGGHIDDARAHGLQDHLLLDEPVEHMAIHALDLLSRLIDDDSLPKAEISVPFATNHLRVIKAQD